MWLDVIKTISSGEKDRKKRHAESQSKYQKKNRKEINEKRKLRYRSDAEFRESVLQANRESVIRKNAIEG